MMKNRRKQTVTSKEILLTSIMNSVNYCNKNFFPKSVLKNDIKIIYSFHKIPQYETLFVYRYLLLVAL